MGTTDLRLIRRGDWESRLVRFIASRRDEPFAWGRHDCCLFAADCIEAMTGVDPAARLRGYSDRRGAVAALRGFADGGLAGVMSAIAEELGAAEVEPDFARRGDAAYVVQESGAGSFGIVLSEGVAVAGLPRGVAMLPRARVVRTWRVG